MMEHEFLRDCVKEGSEWQLMDCPNPGQQRTWAGLEVDLAEPVGVAGSTVRGRGL